MRERDSQRLANDWSVRAYRVRLQVYSWFRDNNFSNRPRRPAPGEVYGFCVTERMAVRQNRTGEHEPESN